MAGSGVAFVLSTFCLYGVFADTIHSHRESILRREPSRVYMNPNGELLQSSPGPEDLVHEGGNVETADKLSADDREGLKEEFCNYDFPMGKEGSNNCTDDKLHTIILQEAMCIEAAIEAGATTTHDSFRIAAEWQYKHPKGCFKMQCSEASNGVCYFFNGNGDTPNLNITGTPVCSRKMLLNSTKPDTNGGCPEGYSVVDNEDTCQSAANCLGKAASPNFRTGIANASKHLDYPRGCFIDAVDDKVYYNANNSIGEGTHVKGTLICNVSNTVHWGKTFTAGEKTAIKAHHKVEEKVDQKGDQKGEQKVEEKGDQKGDQKVEEKGGKKVEPAPSL